MDSRRCGSPRVPARSGTVTCGADGDTPNGTALCYNPLAMSESENPEITLQDLSRTELLALVALGRRLVELDGQVSSGEAERIAAWGNKIGADLLRETLDASGAYLDGKETLQKLAVMVQRREAQELVFGELFELATENGIVREESDLLDWLEKTWNLASPDAPYRS
jgi:hypothetical protein